MTTIERPVTIQNRHGLHARPAAEIVKTAAKFRTDVQIVRDDLEVNAKSIMGVMLLAAGQGTQVKLRVEGEDEQAAADAVQSLFARRFDEDS